MKIKPKSITIERAEGLIAECIKLTVSSWDEADAVLRRWSESAPKTGGYDKCDFWIVFEDGETYEGRYDLKHWSCEPPCLEDHVRGFVQYLAGIPPRWMLEPKNVKTLARYHADRRAAASEIDGAKEWLAKYDLNQKVEVA